MNKQRDQQHSENTWYLSYEHKKPEFIRYKKSCNIIVKQSAFIDQPLLGSTMCKLNPKYYAKPQGDAKTICQGLSGSPITYCSPEP